MPILRNRSSSKSSSSMSNTQTSPPSTTTTSRFSFRHKAAASPPAAADPHQPAPMSARESLLRVARGGWASAADVPTISIHRAEDDFPSTMSNGREVHLRSPGDDGFDVLLDPVGYSTKANGVPSFRHEEFGWCANPDWRHTSQYNAKTPVHNKLEEPPYYIYLTTYVSYMILIFIGHIRDYFGKRFFPADFKDLMAHNGYAALNSDFDSFYTRRLKQRIDDCFSHPVTGVPGRTIQTYDRSSTDGNLTYDYTGETTRALNISSYNYLGFAQATGGCADAVAECVRRYGVSAGGSRLDGGTLDLHVQAEALVARFLGHEDAMVVSMGFATNSTTLPALVSKGCLVISDEHNHSSIRFGVRLSGASVRMFKHNDMDDLEAVLREAISQGQPRTHRPWKKILVAVEGLYSMEGTLVDLPKLLEFKRKYKFYLYVDEAHSIGALGPHGRGVCDYFGIDPRQIDILMGTFTKSFGAAGGYVAGSHETISLLRLRSHAMCYAEAIAPPVLTQIVASMGSIMGVSPPLPSTPALDGQPSNALVPASMTKHEAYGPAPAQMLPGWLRLPPNLLDGSEGTDRLRRLAFNSRYLSCGLRKLGFIVYGHRDSPIVPLLTFNPAKMPLFSRMMSSRAIPIVTVIVGYPATPLPSSRVRFCCSASHTKADIDLILQACDEVGDILDLKHGKPEGGRWALEDVLTRAAELVRD